MSEGITLEKMKVVVEADARPYANEMKKVREDTKGESQEFQKQNDGFRKSMNERTALTQKLRTALSRINDATYGNFMRALKLPGTKELERLNAAKVQMKNPLAGLEGFDREQFRNPAGRVLGSAKELQKEIETTEKQLKKLLVRREELESSGGATELTADYKEMSKAVEQAERSLNRLLAKKERLSAIGGLTAKNQKGLDYDISQAENTLKYAKAALDDMPSGERFQSTDKWRKLNREIEQCKRSLAEYHAKEQEISRGTAAGKASKSFAALRNRLKDTNTEIKRSSGIFAALVQKLKNSTSHMKLFGAQSQKSGNSLGMSLKSILRYGLSLRMLFIMANKLRTALGEGMQNLAKYSNEYGTPFNKNLSQIHSSLLQVKNALATAFEPIVNAAAPYLVTLIRHLTAGANALAQFFSALTGSKTWTKATYNMQNYAASMDQAAGSAKELKNELYGFDEITKQSDPDIGGSGSGGAGGIAAGDMFTEEMVGNQFADFAQMVKDAWEKADFTEIGELVGKKLNDALENISWDSIKEAAEKAGKSFATLINGFVQETDFTLVGSTVANGLNTAIQFALSMGLTLDFEEIGLAIADSVNGFFDTFDFGDLAETLNVWVDGIEDGIKAALTGIDWKRVFSGIGEFLEGLDADTVAFLIGAAAVLKLGPLVGAAVKNGLGTVKLTGIALEFAAFTTTVTGTGSVKDTVLSTLEAGMGTFMVTGNVKVSLIVAGITFLVNGTVKAGNWLGKKFVESILDANGLDGSKAWDMGDISLSQALKFQLDVSLDDKIDLGKKVRPLLEKWAEENHTELLLPVIDLVLIGDLEQFQSDIGNLWDDFLSDLASEFKERMEGLAYDAVKSFVSAFYKISGGGVLWKLLFGDKTPDDIFPEPKSTTKTNPGGRTSGGGQKAFPLSADQKKSTKSIGKAMEAIVKAAGPLKVAVEGKTAGKDVMKPYKDYFGENDLVTGVKTSNTGADVHLPYSAYFMKNHLITAVKTSNTGADVYNVTQNDFKKNPLKTSAVSTTTGNAIRGLLQNTFGATPLSTGVKLNDTGENLSDRIRPGFSAKPLGIGVTIQTSGKELYNQIANSLAQAAAAGAAIGINVRANVSGNVKGKADGGVFAGGSWRPVTAYAGGGLPDTGQMFIARERGPELVGTIGSHTAVLNNGQIVSSVAAGVAHAVAGVMAQFSGGSVPAVYVYLGSKEITDYVIKDVNQRTLATGACPISP